MATSTRIAGLEQSVIPDDATRQRVDSRERSSGTVLGRIGAIAAPAGAILLLLSSMLHPTGADPNDHHAAFTEYAADSIWVWSHLGQFLGFALLGVAMAALAMTFEAGRASAWGRIGLIGAAAVVTIAAMLQAVDGIALKVMVDRWADATGAAEVPAFEAAFAVRQIEIGLASFLSLVTGLTVIVFGLAIVLSRRYPTWLGAVGLIGGLTSLAGGTAQATSGFSELAMMLSMSASVVVILWAILAGVLMWRLAPRLSGDGETA